LKKAQTNKYVGLNASLQEIIDLTRTFREKLPPHANTVVGVRKQVEEFQKTADNVDQLDGSGKNKLLGAIGMEEEKIKKVDKELASMTLALKGKEKDLRNDIFAASKDAKFRPILDKYRNGTADFDREHAEIYDGATELAGRFARLRKQIEKGETIESVLEELNKMVTIMESAMVGHFRETVEIMKERTPTIMGWIKDQKSMTPRNWQDAALWEDDAKGALDKAPTTSRMLETLAADMKRYGVKYGQNAMAKPLLAQVAKLYQAALKDRETMLKFSPPYRKQLQTLLESNHS